MGRANSDTQGANGMIYPALSIRQPWPWAMLHADKDVENRSWHLPLKYIGVPVLIHASKSVDHGALELVAEIAGESVPDSLPTGGIVGAMVFEGENNYRATFSPWRFADNNWWAIERAWALPFHPCKGRQRFFEVEYPFEVCSQPKGEPK